MPENYKHLSIERENLDNDRRRPKRPIPISKPENLKAHAQKLSNDLLEAIKQSGDQSFSDKDNHILKINYSGSLSFNNLEHHGVEFVSHEDKQICIVCSSKDGLDTFIDHLQRLGSNDADITYKQALESLEGIDNWTIEDRKSWAIQHKGLPITETFKLDIELWPVCTSNHPKRIQLYTNFERWLTDNQIRRIDRINQDSLLMYRIEVNQSQAQLILNHRDIRLVDLLPQTGISYHQLNVDIAQIPQNLPMPSADAARVCILDSGINSNHPLLKTAVAESESYVQGQDIDDDAGHGTAVAGIALYGDVEGCTANNFWEPQFWLFNGKILYRDPHSGEACFDEKTIEKTIIEAVNYFAEEHGCRIFNLSIGNRNAPYDGRHVRGIAYVLDTLARKHNVLFVVSAGNFNGSEEPPIPEQSWRDEYPRYLIDNASVIIDPAPALNALTVGSLARHNATVNSQRRPDEINELSPASENQPSPFTRHGPSVKGALKPELMAYGGNLASPIIPEGRQWRPDIRGLGVLTMNHDFVGNTLLKEISGTSFAAPYVTHLAGRLLNEYPEASANLLRALLVNHAKLPHECINIFSEEAKKQYGNATETKNRELVREIAGYGSVDEDILFRSSENSVVLIAEDSIENDAYQFYELPLPEKFLRSNRAIREIRVTLAYSPVVRTTRMDYTATKINYRLVKGNSLDEIQRSFNHETQNETDSRSDDVDGKRRIISTKIRDKGTVQSSIWMLKQLNPNEKWFVVVTRQDRDWGVSLSLEQENYALVITVTDKENQEAQLYTQIKQRIQERVRIQV
ncbi:MAG: S8 family peptidase [bacterium]|nr:S8 family peptidase [bacterium]